MKPVWLITYEGVDISDELTPMVLSAEYTDHLEGSSDELRLTLEDRQGRWREGWWPSKGDRLSCQFGMSGEPLLDAGQFSVDTVELRGSPDTVTISALAAEESSALKTRVHRAFDETTLGDLSSALAGELDLELVGDVGSVPLARVTQAGETNVAFLRRLAKDYGYAFSIRPPHLVFYAIAELESVPPVVTLDRFQRQLLSGWTLKGSTQDTYVACELTWFDARIKGPVVARVEAAEARQAVVTASEPSEQTAPLKLPTRTLREGDTGDDVRDWQTFLASRGLYGAALDGIFGPITRQGTVAFQRSNPTLEPDGVAGPETYRVANESGYATPEPAVAQQLSGRVLRIERRVESAEQAELQARAALAAANRLRVTGSLPALGDRRVVAGATVELTNMGRLSGRYLVQRSTHRISRSAGYTTTAEVTYV